MVWLSIAGLALHLALIFLARTLDTPPPLIEAVGTNYLAALYTPFSLVLFYEVFLLILAIPESTTSAMGKQYEILSLIVVRNVFKDIAAFESVTNFEDQLQEFGAVLLDLGGGLVMFVLVAAFYHVNRRRPVRVVDDPDYPRRVDVFIERKKAIALALSFLFFILAGTSLLRWCADVINVVHFGATPVLDVRTIFYLDLFTIMIFADALILILSLLLATSYELVFRNAAFVGSAILLRFSLAVQKPYDVELGVLSIAFGVLVLLIYNYYLKVNVRGADPPPDTVVDGSSS